MSYILTVFGYPGFVDLLRWPTHVLYTNTGTAAVNKGVDLKRFACARMCKLFDVKGV